MLLHDFLCVALYSGFIFGCLPQIGCLGEVIHDVTEVLFHLAKAVNTSTYEEYSIYPFVFNQFMWVYFRLICFPAVIYELATTTYPPEYAQFQPFIYLSVMLLSILFCMHILWFMMFQRLNLAHYHKHKNLDDVMHIGGITTEAKK